MNWYTVGWWAWLGYFGVLETAALVQSYRARKAGADDPRDTFSEHVWVLAGVNKGGIGIERNANAWARIRRVMLGGFMLWLSVHFLAGGSFF